MRRPEKNRVTKFRFFTVWQEGKEEQWFKTMSAKGWHLSRVGLLNYEFEKGEPRAYEYALDFRVEARRDLQEYLGLVVDSGWEHLGNMGGWQYFRIDADKAELAPIYSDKESLAGKYRQFESLCRDAHFDWLPGAVLIMLMYGVFRTFL